MTCPNGHGDWFASSGICTCLVCGTQWRPGFALPRVVLGAGPVLVRAAAEGRWV